MFPDHGGLASFPIIVLKRQGFTAADCGAIQQMFHLLFGSGRKLTRALAEAASPMSGLSWIFLRALERFDYICRVQSGVCVCSPLEAATKRGWRRPSKRSKSM